MPTTPTAQVRNPHPVPADGAFQLDRLPAALQTSYVGVDEMSTEAWVDYVARLAEFVTYFDETEAARGHWQPFYSAQPAALVARILSWPLERLAERISAHRESIEDNDLVDPEGERRQLLSSLFDLVGTIAIQLDGVVRALPVNSPLHLRAGALIRHRLVPDLARWMAYHKAAAAAGLLDDDRDLLAPELVGQHPLGGPSQRLQDLIDSTLSLSNYWSEGEDWGAYAGAVNAQTAVYGTDTPGTDPAREIVHAVGHTFFHGIYEGFVTALLHLRQHAQAEWERLQQSPDHAPHLALLLAFLEVRRRQQSMLNALTDRHLDFYYRRVLRLAPAAAAPPQAFLHLEARNGVAAAYLPAGTVFRGGKDETTKRERRFLSNAPVSVSTARIAEMRAIFKVAQNPSIFAFPGENRPVFAPTDGGRVYAATVVNSSDGLGKALPEGSESWHPFGHRAPTGTQLTAGMSTARQGLAISSHYLYLAEGTRTVRLTMYGIEVAALVGKTFNVALSTEEGWWESTATVAAGPVLTIDLSPNDPAITAYDEEVHALGLDVRHPVLQLTLRQVPGVAYDYQALRGVELSNIVLAVEVGGAKQLQLSGPTGPLDPSKSFYPFGAAPTGKEVLTIGHPESFQKAANIDVKYGWKNPVPGVAPDMWAEMLTNGSWVRHENPNESIGSSQTNNRALTVGADSALPAGGDGGKVFSAAASRGFVRFQLQGNFGHRAYPGALARALAVGGDNPTLPALPFEPELAYLTLDYDASITLGTSAANDTGDTQIHHLLPFGTALPEVKYGRFPFLAEVLPQTEPTLDAGALYLGIEAWTPGSQLSLLVVVDEGSADPLLEKPADHLTWEYLHDNQWTAFPADKLQDSTDALLRSGLVRLDLPAGTQARNRRFGDELLWLRIRAGKHTDAVNYLRGVHAHGIQVTQELAAADALGISSLAPSTITKLLLPAPGIKKITQAYPSFGGRPTEARDAYFTRQSERLRHKDRSITEWDYEHLVLEAFPAVDRVICLQHLEFAPGATTGNYTYHELRAGHVTILPLGQSGGSRANLLRPYVSLTTREDIANFLRARMSCHVTLHVRNPLFEEVRVVADVRFREGTDEAWALQQIDTDLIGHLSPWTSKGLGDLNLAAEIHRSVVLNFLEELDYVDYVKNLSLRHLADATQNGQERLKPTKLVAVLVAATHHLITPLPAQPAVVIGEVCKNTHRSHRGRNRITIENPIA